MKNLSVVIPLYNSATFIEETLRKIEVSAGENASDLEVIVVDDGSTDGSAKFVEKFANSSQMNVKLFPKSNSGVFLAIWEGAQNSAREWLLILNSRQILDDTFFDSLSTLMAKDPKVEAWSSHVETDSRAPLIGHFWTVLTAVFWGSYWRELKRTEITSENFDKVPKGTGGLAIKRELFYEHCIKIWPKENQRFISDDTKLLRSISSEHQIVLEPGLRSIYRPRVTLPGFLKHSFNRGTLFIDSYMNTSLPRFGILLASILSPFIFLSTFLLLPNQHRMAMVSGSASLFLIGVLTLILMGLRNHAPVKSALSFLVYSLPFAVVFWAGLARGLVVHRGTLKVRKS